MARPPFVFGYPEITMGENFYMGEPPPVPFGDPEGYYMGETQAEGELYSAYSEGHPTLVATDSLSPEPVSLFGKRLLATESVNVVNAGRVTVTLEFTKPVYNELAQEFLLAKGPATSGTEIGSTAFGDLASGTYSVFAGGLVLGAPGGSSIIPLAPNFGAKLATVALITGFAIGQWVKIRNPIGGEICILKIASISGADIKFESDILMTVEDGATIDTVNDFVQITEVTDYTIDLLTGNVSVLETAATNDQLIWIEYKTNLTDYSGVEFWLIPGLSPVPDYSDPIEVSGHGSAIFLGAVNDIPSIFSFEKDGNFLGRDYTLYAIAIDDEVPVNPSLARAIQFTFIPARAVSVSTDTGNSRVTLKWNDVRTDGSAASGYNVVRNDGQTFIPAIAQKLNLNLIPNDNPLVEFTDEDGAPNRVPILTVPAPVNNLYYTYAIESGIVTGQWTILTANLRDDQFEILIAEKELFD